MNYKVIIFNCFKKQLKKYIKKFPNIKNDLISNLNNFSKKNVISLWWWNYKFRLKSSDLKKWENKSFRIIIHLIEKNWLLLPISIYLKSDKENISKKEINQFLEETLKEINEK